MPVLTRVSQATRPLRVLGHDRVEDAVGDLVGDLVGVALGDGLGREEVLALGERLGRHGGKPRGICCTGSVASLGTRRDGRCGGRSR